MLILKNLFLENIINIILLKVGINVLFVIVNYSKLNKNTIQDVDGQHFLMEYKKIF